MIFLYVIVVSAHILGCIVVSLIVLYGCVIKEQCFGDKETRGKKWYDFQDGMVHLLKSLGLVTAWTIGYLIPIMFYIATWTALLIAVLTYKNEL